MGLSEYISKKRVLILKSKTKKGAISELVRAVVKDLPGITREQLLRSVWEREALLTTRIAPAIAIPHARIAGLKRTIVAVGKSHAGVLYGRHKSDLVHLFFLIVGGESTHLKALGTVASMLQSPD
ncbi:MAG: PTS sugar transporter subunit IIA, partial [Lentisphaerae bacterium]|nr:PTS sugar transporter subunit IIA [Lentisphaerota bacterium]